MAEKTTTQMQRYGKIRRRRVRAITVIILALFLLAVLIGAVSYYGDHVGNFMISVEKDSRVALSLSEEHGFLDPKDVLTPMGVKDQTNISFYDLPSDELNPGTARPENDINKCEGGLHSDTIDHQYFAYTFFLKNASRSRDTIDYEIRLSLRTTTKNVDEAIRIMLIRDRDIKNLAGTAENPNMWIFAKADVDPETGNRITEGGKNITVPYNGKPSYESTAFESSTRIATIPIKAFPVDAITTYTVVMWLEGDDPDCVDAIKGGAVMLDMEFAITNIIES